MLVFPSLACTRFEPLPALWILVSFVRLGWRRNQMLMVWIGLGVKLFTGFFDHFEEVDAEFA